MGSMCWVLSSEEQRINNILKAWKSKLIQRRKYLDASKYSKDQHDNMKNGANDNDTTIIYLIELNDITQPAPHSSDRPW